MSCVDWIEEGGALVVVSGLVVGGAGLGFHFHSLHELSSNAP